MLCDGAGRSHRNMGRHMDMPDEELGPRSAGISQAGAVRQDEKNFHRFMG